MSQLPATPVFLGLPWDPALFAGRGHHDLVVVAGQPYRRFQGMHVAALLELDGRVVATGQGVPNLYRYAFDTGTADADPGAGKVRLNAPPGDATLAFIDTADETGADLSAAIGAWDDSTSAIKGTLRLASRTRAAWAEYDVTGAVVVAAGYRKLAIAFKAAVGLPFAADEPVLLGYAPRPDRGQTGADGDVSAAGAAAIADGRIAATALMQGRRLLAAGDGDALDPTAATGPTAMAPTNTAGGIRERGLDFDAAVVERAQIRLCTGAAYGGGALELRLRSKALGGTGGVRWGARAAAIKVGDQTDVSFGDAVELATSHAVDGGHYDTVLTVVPGNAPAAGADLVLEVYRAATHVTDGLLAVARLATWALFETAVSPND